MNQSVIFAVFTILSLRCESLSSRLHKQNFSDIEQILVQTFKKKLLKELGFSSVPNISAFKAVKFPPIYAHLVEAENSKFTQQSEEDEDDFHAKTKRIFLFPEEGELYFYFAGEIACEAITTRLIMKSSDYRRNVYCDKKWRSCESCYFLFIMQRAARGLENVNVEVLDF